MVGWRRATTKAAALLLVPLALALSCGQKAEDPELAPPPKPVLQSASVLAEPRNDIPGLENFAKVSDTLYRGAQPGSQGFAELKRMGVRTVVNLRDHHSDRDELAGLGLRYVHIPCETSDPEVANVVAFLKVVTDPANQPVFVHCQHGADRTGMMVACYRMAVQGWERETAVSELFNFGFHPVWQDIKKFLAAFDAEKVKQNLPSAQPPRVEVVP